MNYFKKGYQEASGWRSVIDDGDCINNYTEHDRFRLSWTCRYVVEAIKIALEKWVIQVTQHGVIAVLKLSKL